jgi:hypothetical protein
VAAARINSRPFGTNTTRLVVPAVDSVERLGRFNYQVADPDYFAVMGTRILRGRGFTEADGEGAPAVAVVSRSMARALWKDPIGRCIQVFFGPDALAPCTTVIGIAEDAAQQNLTDDPDSRFMYYLPLDQVDPSWGSQLFLRMAGHDAGGSVERVRLALNRAMPGQGYVSVQPMEDLLDRQRRSWQLGATLFVGFGVLALLVAAVGLYGTVSYDVAQRTHELGVRSALGARGVDLVRLVVGQAVRLAGAGVVLGLALALLASPWIQPLLFKQSARDPATYGLVAVLLLGVAVLASAMPSRRAARVDPNLALRAE